MYKRLGGQLATVDSTGAVTALNGVAAPGSSPSMAYLHGSAAGAAPGYITAFRGTDGTVWTSTAQVAMAGDLLSTGTNSIAAGTSPAVTVPVR